MITYPSRRVRTLRLKAPSDDLVRRGAILFEDALHSASIPEAEAGCYLIVRRLDIGAIRGDQSSASIALRIENALLRLRASAVHAAAADAESRPAVYFRSALEACILLARRIARQEGVSEWFWPPAVKAWQREMPRHQALRVLLGEALRTELGVVAGAAMLRDLSDAGAADRLLESLDWQDGVALLRLAGWSAPGLPAVFVDESLPDSRRNALAPWLPLIARWVGQWGVEDARSLWLAATVLLAENPECRIDPRLPWRAMQLINQARRTQVSETTPPANSGASARSNVNPARESSLTQAIKAESREQASEPESIPGPDKIDEGVGVHSIAAPASLASPDQAAPSVDETESRPSSAARDDVVVRAVDASTKTSPWSDYPLPTAFGGLLFLLPVMARLGMPEWLEAHPEMIEIQFPHRLLRYVACVIGAPGDDPILAALSAEGPKPELRKHSLWRQASLESLDDPDALCRAWIRSMRRWCRRHAELNLRTIVCRPGRVLATRTHVDILFDLNQSALGIRRAGLDLNPGWLPWFGRVVTFHYLPGEQMHEF